MYWFCHRLNLDFLFWKVNWMRKRLQVRAEHSAEAFVCILPKVLSSTDPTGLRSVLLDLKTVLRTADTIIPSLMSLMTSPKQLFWRVFVDWTFWLVGGDSASIKRVVFSAELAHRIYMFLLTVEIWPVPPPLSPTGHSQVSFCTALFT